MAAPRKKKRSTRQAVRDGERSIIPPWVWLALGVAMGVSLTVLLVMSGLFRPPAADLPRPGNALPPERDLVDEAPEPRRKKNDFDFFTVLPEMEVVIPEQEIDQRVRQREDVASKGGPYQLQVASFRNAADAERTKAELAFLGIVAHVIPVTINDARWHRVRVGPVESAREADGVRRQLQSAGYSVMVLSESG